MIVALLHCWFFVSVQLVGYHTVPLKTSQAFISSLFLCTFHRDKEQSFEYIIYTAALPGRPSFYIAKRIIYSR
ncbi:hypothetical protein ASPBRDRAFT_234841 [Aspergillus brasiliensis CBS 101740]|uniref:Secreted protein n=1 Tax=Aspergillus brasiliensis (strain CBS 101740 / IMI 381727 / IBT 21946) TaxID=767769 RepID=A0A1L9V057_ASPBC|nr:hypothetical protein ASPBRDRAFT_234841 [Aspergillus brasiliensis CBS 101740]